MQANRREFTAGVLCVAAAGHSAVANGAVSTSRVAEALAAIGDYTEVHRRFFTLPAVTLSVATPDGWSTTIDRGFADLDTRRPIAAGTLFQIGSITKSITAAVIHQLAAEGKLRLDGDARPLLPDAPWPAEVITVQHLLDHDSGLPEDGPKHPSAGRLWLGFKPGEHWSYSNVGYILLGRIAEEAAGAPLRQLIEARVLAPLGMSRSRGAVTAADRLASAQGYEPFDLSRPYVRGSALRPAPWLEISEGSGSVASTAADMTRYLRSLAGAAQGRVGFGLSPEHALAYTRHFVPSGEGGMRYGNGLMHVTDAGSNYIHHTGGGPFGSAAFHLDAATGIGAFAGTTISAWADYRPTKLTLFAVQAVAAARAGRPLPSLPALEPELANPASFAGRYDAGDRNFTVASGRTLVLRSGGREAPLQSWNDDLFRTSHPDFADYAIWFERVGGRIVGASWGSEMFLRQGAGGKIRPSNPELAQLAGRFVSDSPYGGVMRIVERGGRLWVGTDMPLTRLGGNLWRVGKADWSPERAEFADFFELRPQTLTMFGIAFERRDI